MKGNGGSTLHFGVYGVEEKKVREKKSNKFNK